MSETMKLTVNKKVTTFSVFQPFEGKIFILLAIYLLDKYGNTMTFGGWSYFSLHLTSATLTVKGFYINPFY